MSILRLRNRHGHRSRHRLDSDKIVETAKNLSDDIHARLPGSSLAMLALELLGIAMAAEKRGEKARSPIYTIRVASGLAVGLVLLALWYLFGHLHVKWQPGTVIDVMGGLNTAINLVALLAGALWFFITLEARLKRQKALAFIEELREFIHVIDVTQLYYTPDLYRSRLGNAPTNLTIDETYLLYCTQMLAVISNLAPLYTRGSTGDSILRAASEVEMLAIAITTKHLSKAEAVRMMTRAAAQSSPPTES